MNTEIKLLKKKIKKLKIKIKKKKIFFLQMDYIYKIEYMKR
jgi:hypothetical protein